MDNSTIFNLKTTHKLIFFQDHALYTQQEKKLPPRFLQLESEIFLAFVVYENRPFFRLTLENSTSQENNCIGAYPKAK